jgi:hypothetical protein
MLDNLFVLAFLIFQFQSSPTITSPVEGAILKDIFPITGNSAVEGFQSADLTFTYAREPVENWFVITLMSAPVTDGVLTQWDTNSITDGDYFLRLQIHLQDGSINEVIVRDLRIRNYTEPPTEQSEIIESAVTPELNSIQSTILTSTVVPSLVPVLLTPVFNPAPLPVNPAALDQSMVFSMVRTSVLVTILVFVILGFFLRSRRDG